MRESAGKLFFALDHERDDLTQDALALEGGQAARRTKGFYGGSNGSFGVLFAALGDSGDQVAVVGRADLDDIALLLPTAIHKKAMRRNRRDRHFCHDLSEPPGKRLPRL